MGDDFRKSRVIALIDMDCFYCQVEQREKPELWGCPVAVVQYNQYQGGVIIAMSYEARAYGIRRGMRGEQAKELCPNLNICRVPVSRYAEKAELSKYRDASVEVFDVLCNFDERILVERASVDEAYIDLTALIECLIKENDFAKKFHSSSSTLPTTHIANGMDKFKEKYNRESNLNSWLRDECQRDPLQLRLAVGAEIVEIIRGKIKECTQFHCSAGIGTNKILAKLVCSRHKPKEQTIITPDYVPKLFETTCIIDVRGLGGKLGHQLMDRYKIKFMNELKAIERSDLEENFPHAANFIKLICQGTDEEPVKPRDKQLSIAASRNFSGKSALVSVYDVKCWLRRLVNELSARLITDQIKNKRTAQSISCGCKQNEHATRTTALRSYDSESMFSTCWKLLKTFNKSGDEKWSPPVKNIYLSAHHFKAGVEKPNRNITEWLKHESDSHENVEKVSAVDESIVLDTSLASDSSHSFIFEDEFDPSLPSSSKEQESASDILLSGKNMAKNTCINNEISVQKLVKEDIQPKIDGCDVSICSSDLLPTSFENISEIVLESMPLHIRKELMEYYKLKEGDSTLFSEKQTNILPRSSLTTTSKSKVKKKASQKGRKLDDCMNKKISEFFRKS